MLRARITGVGGYLPARLVTNDELSRTVDTSDEWIVSRTGIRQRHLASPEETCSVMGTRAAEAALRSAGIAAGEVDAIILATATPDEAFPASAVRVQAALGITRGFAFDVSAACSGFIYGLATADAFIRAGTIRTALVIGSEVYSRILDWQDRTTCVLFGDGAGAVVLQAGEATQAGAIKAGAMEAGAMEAGAMEAGAGILSTHLHANGAYAGMLYVDGAVGRHDRPGTLVMKGQEVFRHAVSKLAGAVDEALAANGLSYADVDWLVPHQANRRIIDAMGRRLGLPPERVVVTVDRHANTSAASIPLALAEAVEDGRIRPGQLVLMEALGGGLTWGSALVRM